MEYSRNTEEISVSELSRAIKNTLEGQFGRIRVRGEINSLARPSSGHVYFSLVDPLDNTRIQAACWRGQASKLSMKPEDGQEVIVHARLTAYGARSQYQLIVENIELAGMGALLKMLEERKQKLMKEGLFDQARKKPLPAFPRRLGVITSEKGAVWQDILHRIEDRFPLPITLCPVLVQGEGAARQVSAAIRAINALPDARRPDVLIVARGGGSMEDLLTFQEEEVVRAVAASSIPLISAIGHETDTTLIDHAADIRAPTPTAAAELAVPVKREILRALDGALIRLKARVQDSLENCRLKLQKNATLFARPERCLEPVQQRLDYAVLGLKSAMQRQISTALGRIESMRLRTPREILDTQVKARDFLSHRLQQGVASGVRQERARLQQLKKSLHAPDYLMKHHQLRRQQERLVSLGAQLLARREERLTNLSRLLQNSSITSTLARGFALITDSDGRVISQKDQASKQPILQVRFADGTLSVKSVNEKTTPS